MISSFPHKIKSILTEQPKNYSAKTKFSERIHYSFRRAAAAAPTVIPQESPSSFMEGTHSTGVSRSWQSTAIAPVASGSASLAKKAHSVLFAATAFLVCLSPTTFVPFFSLETKPKSSFPYSCVYDYNISSKIRQPNFLYIFKKNAYFLPSK
jgi:hypothetical protein